MLRNLILVVFVCSFCLLSCQQPQLTDEEISAIKDEVKLKIDEMIEAAANINLDKMDSLLATKKEVLMGNNGYLFTSAEQIISTFRKGTGAIKSQDIKLNFSKIDVLSRDAALFSGEGNYTVTDNAGIVSPLKQFVWTFVLVKEENDWKFVQLHQSFAAIKKDGM